MNLKPLAANITEIEIGDKTILFSYKTPVAYHEAGVGYFKTNKFWSATTTRHINKWLAMNGFSGNMDRLSSIDQVKLDNLLNEYEPKQKECNCDGCYQSRKS